MTTQQRPESVALVEAPAVGTLPVHVQQALELRKLSNQIAGKLSEMNWGQKLDHATRRAVADWGQRYDVDVTTEIHVLGGNVYLNAQFYLRRLARMVDAGVIEYAVADHVEVDARLEKMGGEGDGETTRRLRERIKHQIPDEAKSAVVFRIKHRNMEHEVTGAKWCGGGSRKNDPVGDSFPVETSESRAARRAMRLLVSFVPNEGAAIEVEAIAQSADMLGDRIVEANRSFDARELELNRPPAANALPAGNDPYGPPAPSFDELAVSLGKLIKHEKLTDVQRERLLNASAGAKTVEDLEQLVDQAEKLIDPEGAT